MENYNISESKSPIRSSTVLRGSEAKVPLDQSCSAQSLANLSVVSSYLRASQEEKASTKLKRELKKADVLAENTAKKHFFRSKGSVNKHYILSSDEIMTEK